MQVGLGWSALHAGLTAATLAVGAAMGSGLSVQVLTPRFGRRALMAGALLNAASFAAYAIVIAHLGPAIHSWQMVVPLFGTGLGFGLVVAPLVDLVLTGVPVRDAGSGSGVLNTAWRIGSALGELWPVCGDGRRSGCASRPQVRLATEGEVGCASRPQVRQPRQALARSWATPSITTPKLPSRSASMYASTTHWRSVKLAPRSSRIEGRATFTTVMSSRSMKVATKTAISVHHLRAIGGVFLAQGLEAKNR
jgi:Major Facilitator Superfamily